MLTRKKVDFQKAIAGWALLVGLGVCAVSIIPSHRANAADGVEAPPQVLQVGIDSACLAQSKRTVLVTVKATPIVCEAKSQACRGYEMTTELAHSAFGKSQVITKIPLNFEEMRKSANTRWSNLMFAVTLCEAANGKSKCDESTVMQPLRLSGRYLQAAQYEGVVNLELLANPNQAPSCKKI